MPNDARALHRREHWNHPLNAALARAAEHGDAMVYRHRPTGVFVDRRFVLSVLGCRKTDGGTMRAREWEPVLIDAPALPG